MKRIILAVLMCFLIISTVFAGGFDGNTLFFTDSNGAIRLKFVPSGSVNWTWPSTDGTSGYLLKTDGAGTLSWVANGASAWDDLTAPDANKTLAFTTFTNLFTGTSTAADQWTFRGLGNFGDVSVVKIESMTGNPTDGTVLEVVSHDTDADPLLVTTAGGTPLQVTGAGLVNITGLTGTIDYTDFDVSADGAVTIASDTDNTMITLNPSVATATAIDASAANIATALSVGANDIVGTTGLINYTNFDVNADGDVTAVDGTFSGNVSVTGTWKANALIPASAAPTTLTVDGAGTGGITVGGTSTGAITLGGGATLVNLPSTVDMTLSGGTLGLTDTANTDTFTITNNTMTTGGSVEITANAATSAKVISVTADALDTGTMLYLDSDGIPASTYYIQAYDGAANDFLVGADGATTISGAASTNVLTVTTGDVQIDDGKVEIDTNEDDTTHIIRNQGVTTGPVVEIEETAAAADNAALLIDQNATAATSYGIEIDTAGGTAAYLNLEAAAGDGIQFATPASYTGQLIAVNDTLVGTSGEGIVDIKTTANMATGASLVRLDADTGTLVGATDGFILSVDDDSGAQATSYAVKIDSANNEALHVATGKALFDEQVTFTAGIDSNAGLDVDLATNADLVNIDNAAADLAAGAGIVTVYGSGAAGQTNASYLIRGAWKADGDAQDGFILFEDNSTGAAGNGDDMFKVDSGGAMTVAGNITANGNITGDGATVFSGFLYSVADSGAGPDTLTATDCGKTFYSSQANQTNLPEASTAIGCTLTFVVTNASNYDINPDNADIILGATDAAGDMIRSGTVGDSVTLRAISASQWAVVSMYPAATDWVDSN